MTSCLTTTTLASIRACSLTRRTHARVTGIYDNHFPADVVPGSVFSYGSEHMQIGALVAEKATNKSFRELLAAHVTTPLRMTSTAYDRPANGRYALVAGGASSTLNDYVAFMTALLRGELLSNATRATFNEQQTAGLRVAYSPADAYDETWTYALGHWRECAHAMPPASCGASSLGAFGFYPYVDDKYFFVLARNNLDDFVGAVIALVVVLVVVASLACIAVVCVRKRRMRRRSNSANAGDDDGDAVEMK